MLPKPRKRYSIELLWRNIYDHFNVSSFSTSVYSLNNLGILEKGATHAETKKIDPSVLV